MNAWQPQASSLVPIRLMIFFSSGEFYLKNPDFVLFGSTYFYIYICAHFRGGVDCTLSSKKKKERRLFFFLLLFFFEPTPYQSLRRAAFLLLFKDENNKKKPCRLLIIRILQIITCMFPIMLHAQVLPENTWY